MSSLKAGYTPEIVSKNIKELVKAGRPVKHAVAAALASKRKYAKMAKGGLVEDFDEDADSDFDQESNRSIVEDSELSKAEPDAVASPSEQELQRMLAKKLFEMSEAEEHGYSHGGMIEDAGEEESKPEMGAMSAETSEPMESEPGLAAEDAHEEEQPAPASAALSEVAMKAIADRKKKRRFSI